MADKKVRRNSLKYVSTKYIGMAKVPFRFLNCKNPIYMREVDHIMYC